MSDDDPSEREWERIIQSLQSLVALQDDWDSEGAVTPSYDVIQKAIQVVQWLRSEDQLPPATAVASPSGGIILAWWEGPEYREIEIVNPTRIEYTVIAGDRPPNTQDAETHALVAAVAAGMRR